MNGSRILYFVSISYNKTINLIETCGHWKPTWSKSLMITYDWTFIRIHLLNTCSVDPHCSNMAQHCTVRSVLFGQVFFVAPSIIAIDHVLLLFCAYLTNLHTNDEYDQSFNASMISENVQNTFFVVVAESQISRRAFITGNLDTSVTISIDTVLISHFLLLSILLSFTQVADRFAAWYMMYVIKL